MGSYGVHREKGQSNAEYFADEFKVEILDAATTGGVFYAAARQLPEHHKDWPRGSDVFAIVVPISWGRGYWNFHYKPQDEDMGPFDTKCPDRILDLLSPTDNGDANRWRAKCREYNAAKAGQPKLKVGDLIRFAEPIEFVDDYKGDTFVFLGRSGFRAVGGHTRYRIPRWKEREFTLCGGARVAA